MSRLTKAGYTETNKPTANFSTSYAYDSHGNITALKRSGRTGISSYGAIDDLTLSYQGNQLIKVEDAAPTFNISESADFKNGSNQSIEYAYDKNGNLTKDLNKGIPIISYNSLNLPVSLSIANASGSATNSYTYSADGRKLKVEMKYGVNQTKTTDYVGSVIYENGSLKRILVDSGYIENGKYYYYIQDHLGNNRAVAQSDGTVLQSNHYYPYGMTFTENNTGDSKSQPYKYNGKEFDGERGLNVYDYSAQYMDPTLGRFMTVDPLAEKYYGVSPYAYCGNNPINAVDPDGRDWYQSTEKEGDYIWREGHKKIDGYTNVGSSMSFQLGKDSYLNFYQNVGFKANQAINAFEIINSSGKLQNTLLGKNSVLADESKGELFNALISRDVDKFARPIGETLVEYGAGALTGAALGKLARYVWGKVYTKIAKETGKELFNFSVRAAEHMSESGRAVPVQILDLAVKNSKGIADPRGSKALIHTIEMWKNGKAYNLDVLYNKSTSSIWHFQYSPIKP